MKLKHFGRYIAFMLFISFITLISIKLTNNNSNNNNNIEDKPRLFIKSAEKSCIPNSKKDASDQGVRTSSKYGTSKVKLLPMPNVNLPIIIDFL
ncbi:hypothetical protein [Clostridium sp.]|uniref:hypothetical protein n=1 Tax=Clostridium sp. TaxID=1506 RepID=UPI003D6CEDD7